MKTRKQLVQQCRYPLLPKKAFSVSYCLSCQDNKIPPQSWLGERLSSVSSHGFCLETKTHQVLCQVASECYLLWDFVDKINKNTTLSWQGNYPFLQLGDSVFFSTTNIYQKSLSQIKKLNLKTHPSKKIIIIANIQKVVLAGVGGQEVRFPTQAMTIQKKWFFFINQVHEGLHHLDLQPVETPSLVECPGTEPDLEMFSTVKKTTKTSKGQKVFLLTSPEMSLKKLLCHGWSDIYEIKKCFRNQELGPVNTCEFYLLEWYRTHSHLQVLIKDLYYLLNFLSQKINSTPFPVFKKISMKELFKKHVKMELSPTSSKQDFIRKLKQNSIPIPPKADINDLFHLLFLNYIEPKINLETPLIIYDYPLFQQAYARVNLNNWTHRWELYWQGMELANAFDEVIAPHEQEKRFKQDLEKRKKQGKSLVPWDSTLLQNMRAGGGLPPSVGIALGLDRLFLALHQLPNIHKIRNQSYAFNKSS